MKSVRWILLTACLMMVLLFAGSASGAEEICTAEDAGLDFSEELRIHYPVLTGAADGELLTQINNLIREDCHIKEYLDRAAQLISGGSLTVEWTGGLIDDVFSCAVSAAGAVELARPTHVWTACSADMRDGHRITFSELFTDESAARELIGVYLEEEVLPELSAHLQNGELLPLPESFYLERTGLTLLYPISQLSTLGDRAGDIRISWHVLRNVLDLTENSILSRIGAQKMIDLSAESAEELFRTAAEGMLTDIPAKIGDSVQELTDRYHLLNDPDGFEGGRLFSLEGGCFRGVYLMTDDLTRGWENSKVEGIRMDQGSLWGLCVTETPRESWLAVLGEPYGTAEIGEDKAEMNRLCPGRCDYYSCGEYHLQLYSSEDGILTHVILTE